MKPKENKCRIGFFCLAKNKKDCVYFKKCKKHECAYALGSLVGIHCTNKIARVNACIRYAEEATGNKFIVDDKLETTN